MMSVQPSLTRSTSCGTPETSAWKFSMRSFCQPGRNVLTQSGSVGRLFRSSTDDGRPLEDIQVLGMACDVRHALNTRGTRSDHCNALVCQLVQIAGIVAPRIVVVPPARMERMAGEGLDALYGRQFRAVEAAARHDHKSRPHAVAVIGADEPAALGLQPDQFGHLGAGISPFRRG